MRLRYLFSTSPKTDGGRFWFWVMVPFLFGVVVTAIAFGTAALVLSLF